MRELATMLEQLVTEAKAGRPSALCVVVRTRGSTPQGSGAIMFLRSDYGTVGTLGGGCVEAEVKKRAFQAVLSGQSTLLDFVLDHDDAWDDGLICGGRMDIAVMPITQETDVQPFEQALEAARRREPTTVPVVVEHDGKRFEYSLQPEVPPTLLIAGAGHVGQALGHLAADLDFRVVVIDDRADFASPQRFGPGVTVIVDDIAETLKANATDPACYVVIVTRGHKHDHQALEAVINGPAGYIGLIGSKRKTKLIFKDLAAAGVARERIEKVHTPIGLPIGAVTVPEIAVSIAAELVQFRRKNSSAGRKSSNVVTLLSDTPAVASS